MTNEDFESIRARFVAAPTDIKCAQCGATDCGAVAEYAPMHQDLKILLVKHAALRDVLRRIIDRAGPALHDAECLRDANCKCSIPGAVTAAML